MLHADPFLVDRAYYVEITVVIKHPFIGVVSESYDLIRTSE